MSTDIDPQRVNPTVVRTFLSGVKTADERCIFAWDALIPSLITGGKNPSQSFLNARWVQRYGAVPLMTSVDKDKRPRTSFKIFNPSTRAITSRPC